MAGAELKRDPAIERWAAMREQTHYYFRFNRGKLLPLAILLGVVPAAIAYGSIKGFDFNEKYKNSPKVDMIWRK